jgi:hypothetical protein
VPFASQRRFTGRLRASSGVERGVVSWEDGSSK